MDVQEVAASGFVNLCLACWKPTRQDTFNMDCHTCEHCGNHRQGARQQQHGKACPTGACPVRVAA